MTLEERDQRIAQIKDSDAYLPVKAQRIREIMAEFDVATRIDPSPPFSENLRKHDISRSYLSKSSKA